MDRDKKIRQNLGNGTLQREYAPSSMIVGGGIDKICRGCGEPITEITPKDGTLATGYLAASSETHWLHKDCHDRWLALRFEVKPN